MNKINVVNKNKHAPTDVDFYVGRGSVLGNPYTSKDLATSKATFQAKDKEEAIENYKKYLNEKIETKDRLICDELNRMYLSALKSDINLVCYCAPKDCHGDVIKGIVNAKLIKYYMKNG